MNNIKSYEDYVIEHRKKTSDIFNVINEGGAYGHMDHPFEDNELTFGDMKEICNLTINGLFTDENMVAEKTDGQNLMVCWKDGKLFAARKPAHYKNKGEQAFTKEDIKEFEKSPEIIKQSWYDAMEDLENALSHCDQQKLKDMFRDGERFMSLEVICPETENIIPYDQSMLVFHGWKEYDIDGNEIQEDKESAKELDKLIKEVNKQQQRRFLIRGPQELKNIKPFLNHEEKYKNYIDRITEIMSKRPEYTDDTTIRDYLLTETTEFLYNEIPELKDVEWGKITMDNVAANVSGLNKSIRLNSIVSFLKPYEGVGEKVSVIQKNKKFRNTILKPIISLFMDLGLDTCRNMRMFLALNPSDASVRLRNKYLNSIKEIKETGTDENIAYMENQLASLADPSVLENIIPTEGITFIYKNKIYKLTGYFQVLNNICNVLKYNKK